MTVSDEARRQLLMTWVGELRQTLVTDVAIAERLGVDKSAVSRWASGGGGISLANLVRLAELSDHTVGDMLVMFYGVDPEQLTPTIETATVESVVHGPNGRDRVTRLPGRRYRMLLLLRDDDG